MDGGDDDGGAGAATAPSPRAQLPVSRACPVHPFPLAARGGTWAPARRARLPRLAHALGCAARAIPHAHPSRPHPLGLLLAQFLLCGGLHGRGRSPHRRLGRRPCLHRQLRHRGAGGAAGLLPAPGVRFAMPSHLLAVGQFWYYYDHIVRANELPPNTDCCIFRVRAHAQRAWPAANLCRQRGAAWVASRVTG